MAAALALSIGAAAPAAEAQTQPNFQGGWLFDEPLRDMLRANTDAGRSAADTASNVLLYASIAAPYVDLGVHAFTLRPPALDVFEVGLVDTAAFALSLGAVSLLKTAVGRERPYATEANLSVTCAANPDAAGCGTDRNASFPSGHAAMAFTAAGLVCAHEITLGPRSPWNAATCSTAMAAASATALLRIVADRHYATDTLAGAAIGLTFGLLLPMTLTFARWAPLRVAPSMRRDARTIFSRPAASRPALVNLRIVPFGAAGGGGLAIAGQFF